MTDDQEQYTISCPVESGNRTIWVDVGVMWTPGPGKAIAKIRLNALPLGAVAPLDLLAFEKRKKDGDED